MGNKIQNKNAKIALKQIKFEMAVDYGMSYEDVFNIIENAKSNGILSNYFEKLELKRNLEQGVSPTHFE